jgi:hypothetical protein
MTTSGPTTATNSTTATDPATATNPTTAHDLDVARADDQRWLARLGALGGGALITAPLLITAGAATSPPQESDAPADYIASLAADPVLTSVSASLFHYGWVLFAFGAIAALGLVRGRRGRALTTVGAVLGAFGSIQLSGLLLSDWYLAGLGNTVSMDDAVAVFTGIQDPSFSLWMLTAKAGAILFLPVMFMGLARAGVLSWWIAPLPLFSMVAFGVIGGPVGIALAAALYAPSYVAGARLVARSRARA